MLASIYSMCGIGKNWWHHYPLWHVIHNILTTWTGPDRACSLYNILIKLWWWSCAPFNERGHVHQMSRRVSVLCCRSVVYYNVVHIINCWWCKVEKFMYRTTKTFLFSTWNQGNGVYTDGEQRPRNFILWIVWWCSVPLATHKRAPVPPISCYFAMTERCSV